MGSRWGCCCDLFQSTLSSEDNRVALRLSAQLSRVFSAPQRGKKDRACQNQGSVFASSMSFQSSKKSHRTKVKTGGAWLLKDNCGERRWSLHFFLGSQGVPETWPVYTLGAVWPQPWCPCPDRGDVWPQLGGLETMWVSPHLHGSGSRVWGDHTHTKLIKREEYMRASLVCRN